MTFAANTHTATSTPTQQNTGKADKQPPITIINRLAIKHPVFRRRAGAVLLALMGRVNHQTGLVWPSVATIAKDSGVEERHVQEDLVWMQNTLVNGLPIVIFTGITFGKGVRQWRVNPFFLNPRGDGSGQEGVTDLAGRGDGFRHPEQNKRTDQKKNNNPRDVAGQPDGVVVVLSQDEKGKATAAITKAMDDCTATAQPTVSLDGGTTMAFLSFAAFGQTTATIPQVYEVAIPAQRVAPCAPVAVKPAIHTSPKPVAPTTPPVANMPVSDTIKAEIAAILAKIQPQATIAPATAIPAPATITQPTATIVNGRAIQVKKQAPVQPPAPKPEPAHPAAFHHSLTRKEAAVIITLLAVLPSDLQQAVMAELVAQLDGGNVRRPVGYARRLVEVAQAGEFVPSASREAAQRVEAEQASVAAKRAQAEEERAKAEANASEAARLTVAMEAAGEDQIQALRQQFIDKLKKDRDFLYKSYLECGFDHSGFEIRFSVYLREKLLSPHG